LLKSALLSAEGFRHGFSTVPLDFRKASESAESVRAIADAIGFDPSALYQASQVHGARVVVADGDVRAMLREEADAIVARAGSGDAVGVRIADCTPVLVADTRSGAAVAIHAGWRGVVANVIGEAVARVCGNRATLIAAIGPSIGPCCFEVGDDVAEQIARACGDPTVIVRGGAKPHVDMRRATRAQLRAAGIADARIDDVDACTKHDMRFHSHRRDGERAGRNVAIVVARA
jgi:YfiH family protein